MSRKHLCPKKEKSNIAPSRITVVRQGVRSLNDASQSVVHQSLRRSFWQPPCCAAPEFVRNRSSTWPADSGSNTFLNPMWQTSYRTRSSSGLGLDKMLKLAVKYGIAITIGVAIWVLADHLLFHLSRPGSRLGFLTPVFFNLLQFGGLYFGIKARKLAMGGRPSVRQGIGLGMAISGVYAIMAIIFFVGLYLILGPKLLENEPSGMDGGQPASYVLIVASTSLAFTALFGGLIYSTVISYMFQRNSDPPPQKLMPKRARPTKRH
jgi:hypothetical protein